MNKLSEEDARLLDTLREAGREAVERKRRLGQYAVVWRDGQPAFIGPNPPRPNAPYAVARADDSSFSGVHDRGSDESPD